MTNRAHQFSLSLFFLPSPSLSRLPIPDLLASEPLPPCPDSRFLMYSQAEMAELREGVVVVRWWTAELRPTRKRMRQGSSGSSGSGGAWVDGSPSSCVLGRQHGAQGCRQRRIPAGPCDDVVERGRPLWRRGGASNRFVRIQSHGGAATSASASSPRGGPWLGGGGARGGQLGSACGGG